MVVDMKQQYIKPSMEVVNVQQQGYILAGSITDIDGNTDIDYGGGGHIDPMAPDFSDDFDLDAALP